MIELVVRWASWPILFQTAMRRSLLLLPILLSLCTAARAATGPVWQVATVDSGGAARSVSMKADREGNLHVAFINDDGNRNPLKYAFWDRTVNKWFVMQIAENVATCSLTLDSRQRPHISYVDYGSGSGSKLRYANWNGQAWERQAIPLNSDVIAYFTSIALDKDDRPSISFYEYRGPRGTEIKIRLRNVMRIGNYWQVRTVDPEEGSGKFNCTAAAGNTVHIAYANVSSGTAGMRYAIWQGTSWKNEIVDQGDASAGDVVGYSVCMALDGNGDPHIIYSNETRPSIRYAVRKNNRWEIQVVEPLAGVAYPDRHSIAIGAANQPYLGYFDAGRGELRVAYPVGKRWVVETVDGDGCGFNSSIDVDASNVYIAYSDAVRGGLKVARRPVSANVSKVNGPEPASGPPPSRLGLP